MVLDDTIKIVHERISAHHIARGGSRSRGGGRGRGQPDRQPSADGEDDSRGDAEYASLQDDGDALPSLDPT